jgi:hypothetical protein
MKITENRLRNIINNVLNEMNEESHFLQDDHDTFARQDHDHHELKLNDIHSDKAHACCQMSKDELMKMCAKICLVKPEKTSVCCDLYDCASRKDIDGCCRCLEALCKCPICSSICSECCGC